MEARLQKALEAGIKQAMSKYTTGSHLDTPDGEIHRHPFREILVALEGECNYWFRGCNYRITPGCAVLIDGWDEHGTYYSTNDRHLLHIWAYFIDQKLQLRLCEVSVNGNYSYVLPTTICPGATYNFIMTRWNEYNAAASRTGGAPIGIYMNSPLLILIEEIKIHLLRLAGANDNHSENHDDTGFINALKLYINSRNGRECSLRELEKYSGYNRFYLAHQFKAVTGMTLGDYINRTRLIFVNSALQRGMRQKEIASELGFSSSASFWKWFRNHKGSQP